MGIPACLAGQCGGGIPACLAGQSRGVSNFSGGGSGPGGSPIFRGVSNFSGVSNFGEVSNLGGLRGDPPIFLGGGNFFLISAFFGDTPPPFQTRHQNTAPRSAGTHPTEMHSCSTSGGSIFIVGILYILKKVVAPRFLAKMEKLRDSSTWEEFPCTMKTSVSRTPWLLCATRLNARLSTIATDVTV